MQTGVWKHAIRLTRNGCRILFATSKMFRSDIRLSTSSRAITSPFFRAFMAKYSPVSLYWVNSTCQTTMDVAISYYTNIEICSPKVRNMFCCSRSKIEGNMLWTERKNFSIMMETPVSFCFVIPQRLYANLWYFTLSLNKVNMVVCW